MYGLTTHPLQVERRESHREQSSVCSHHTPATGGEDGERVIETIKCTRSPHTSYRWRGERESHRANQVYALTTHQLQVERRESVIEPIKCTRSPHTSYRWRGGESHRAIKCTLSPHTSYRWRGERSHRDNQVYALTTHTATGGEERES